MDFRNKVKSYISKGGGKGGAKQWKKEIQNEKKQKYLFGGNHPDEQFKGSRKTKIFSKKNRKIEIFSNFFQEKIITGDFFQVSKSIMSAIGIILIALTGYIVILSPYFKISPNQVIIEATTPGIDMAIAYRALESSYGESIFFIDEDAIAKKLKQQLKNIASINITSLYPNGLKVFIAGTPILFDVTITEIADKKWGLSKNGILIPENDLGDTKAKYHLNITSGNFIGDFFLNYKQGISESNIGMITSIFDIFSTEWPDLKLARSGYFAGENELHITLVSGTKIIFSLQNDTEKQPGVIPKIIVDQLITFRTYVANNRNKLIDGSMTYVDARIPGKLFVCSESVVCKNNLILIYGEAYK